MNAERRPGKGAATTVQELAAHSQDTPQGDPVTTHEPTLSPEVMAFLSHLNELGVAVFHAPPRGQDYDRPAGWQNLTRDGNRARWSTYRSGHALMGVTGPPVAVLDVDTKNGADIEMIERMLKGIGVRVYAKVQTPSGGWHLWVPGHPDLPTVHAREGRDGITGYPGLEVLSHGANAFLPGTLRAKYSGAGYTVIFDDLATLADGGDEDSAEALVGWVAVNRAHQSGGDFTPAAEWDGTPPTQRAKAYLEKAVSGEAAEIAGMARQSGRNNALNVAAVKLGNYVAGAGLDEPLVIERLYAAAESCGLVAEDGQASVLATIKSGLRFGRTRPRAVPEARGSVIDAHAPAQTSRPPEERRVMLRRMLEDLRTWQHLPDPTHIIAALAVAATRNNEGEACWLLLVASPSSGKTEVVRMLDKAADARLDEVTTAGLLGWAKGKVTYPSGVLSRIGSRGLLTFGDLSTLLATSNTGGRDQVFALLRRAYDGHTSRDISPPGKLADGAPERLEWTGRLTVIGAVTQAIDRFSVHADELGSRWLYVRLPERTTAEKRLASARARRSGQLNAGRARAREATLAILAATEPVEELSDELAEAIEDAALVTAWGRGSVPRSGYGRREIEGAVVVEEPMRLVQQLGAIARGVLALGLTNDAATAVVRRIAVDSMPLARRAVLTALSTGEVLTTAGVSRNAKVDRKVARMALEDLAAIGVVTNDRVQDDSEEITGTVHWHLLGEDGALIAHVFAAHEAYGGWDEIWV